MLISIFKVDECPLFWNIYFFKLLFILKLLCFLLCFYELFLL